MKSSIFRLFLTVFLLWLTLRLNEAYESYLAYILVITVGIFHGSNDISLIQFLKKDSSEHIKKYLFFYVLLVVITCLIFINIPLIALLIFVGFSCYHFGEQHFHHLLKDQFLIGQLFFTSYGILIFGLIFYFNQEDTSAVILELSGAQLSMPYYLSFLLLGVLSTLTFGYINRANFNDDMELFRELFLILLFALLFKIATLLWAFAIYFIVWHSIPSLIDQIESLHGRLHFKSLIKYIQSSLLYWMISIVGLVLVYYLAQELNIQFITLFFAFLAAITIPHVIVMYYLNKK
ncbi:Brp/Blh family beta-carotene 15,15'-dioxygenase [Winogradskyella poriferorum]|uniref:Brp/Blh family beta-carotene 15,15'-dioxygenase n=1 Tax=Winogradskyella poriferorum TaxID=307627 RepID=UPI003D66119A